MSTALFTPPPRLAPEADQRCAARRDLRRQIALLEDRLTALTIELGEAVVTLPASAAGPRLLDVGGLECTRDRLAALTQRASRRLACRDEEQARARLRLESMLLEPERQRFARVSLAELGEPGCGVYRVRPRLGLIGMLAGWWEVKLSSGCP